MSRRRLPFAIVCAALTLLAPLIGGGAPAQAAINKTCGGKKAARVAASKDVVVVVRTTEVEDDLYGTIEEDYLACVGKRGKARTLTGHGTSTSEALGRIVFSKHFVAFEFTVSDNTCGKYNPGDPCPSQHLISSYNAKTTRPVASVSTSASVTAFAVSPSGAIVWLESLADPAKGQLLRYKAGYPGTATTIATGDLREEGLAVGRSEIRWTDATGAQSTPIPAAVTPEPAPIPAS